MSVKIVKNYTRACGISASQNPIRIFFGDLTLTLVDSFYCHTYQVEIQLVLVQITLVRIVIILIRVKITLCV
jgi:hypothetical protein